MTLKTKSPAGDGGAFECLAGRRDTSKDNPNIASTQYQPCADECLYRLGQALRAGRISRDNWAHGFTLSLLRHNKRRSWVPSPKQLKAMRALVAELAEPDTGPLIDKDDGDDAA